MNRLPAVIDIIKKLCPRQPRSMVLRHMPEGILIPEDGRMKMVRIALAVLLLVAIAGTACAFETDFDDLRHFDRSLPAWKFGRGVVNVLSGPYEFFVHITNAAIDGGYYGAYDDALQGFLAGSTNGIIAGSITGTVAMGKRMSRGLLEMVTFWKPEYGPSLDPEYGTRCMADSDYFDPNPFWYAGPPRY